VLQIGRSLLRSQVVSLEIFIDIKSFRSHYGPGVDSACNRNEYQENFLGVKAAGAKRSKFYQYPVPFSCNLGIYIYINNLKYSVIHKSVKQLKNSQQINYSTDHGSSYADRERNSLSIFYVCHRCSMCPPLVTQQTSK